MTATPYQQQVNLQNDSELQSFNAIQENEPAQAGIEDLESEHKFSL